MSRDYKNWTIEWDIRSWSFGFGFQLLGWMNGAYIALGPLSINYAKYGDDRS